MRKDILLLCNDFLISNLYLIMNENLEKDEDEVKCEKNISIDVEAHHQWN